MSEDEYNNSLMHYGILRRSGRYPWGSGGPEVASNPGFLGYVQKLKNQGLTEKEVAQAIGASTTELRAAVTVARAEQHASDQGTAQRLKDKGYSNVAIGERMGKPESTIRALLAPGAKDKTDVLLGTANMLKDQVAQKKFIDVGSGVERQLNISSTKLAAAVALLKEEGYEVHDLHVPQVTTGKRTRYKVLTEPGVTRGEVWNNRDNLQQIQSFSEDGGRSFLGIHPPLRINPNRVGINYAEDGGAVADGVIYVRPGVKDISLGKARYAQVRIAVGTNHYLKGMAMYKDDLPDGVDLVFNTNKKRSPNKLDALKEVAKNEDGSKNTDNPFGATVRQIVEKNNRGVEKVTSAMNIVHEEGDWARWSKSLSSQMLSKQSPSLAQTQLNMLYERRKKEFEKLSELTNPAVKRKLLETFGDETTKAAVQLKAAALSTRQASHVILPIESMSPSEVYAPNYRQGERVVLIRHPHAGTFEIPELTVNNNHPEAKRLLGSARDAIGIHHSVAEQLSGADFDGDTVIVIPNNSNKIKATRPLDGLKDFDPRSSFPPYEGMPRMTARQKGIEMGKISNLITDMTIMGASTSEMAAAVRHSMVVIDAEKHNLNYRESARVNGIANLSKKYQGRASGGAATLISRAGGEVHIPERVARSAAKGGPIDRATGKRVFEDTGATRTTRSGERISKQDTVKRLSITENAHDLVSSPSGTRIERIYADHSNRMKALGDMARKESVNTPRALYSPSAAKTYSHEVQSINAKLALIEHNRPLERQAQIIANTQVRAMREANPNMSKETLTKVKNQALMQARHRVDAKGLQVVITPEEWAAIQAGAISDSKLNAIMAKADLKVLRELATPKREVLMTSNKVARAKQMLASGKYTRADVADALGVSLTTLDLSTVAAE